MYNNLLVAIDGSTLAHSALEQGVALAKKLDAKITIVTATEPWSAVVVGDAAIGFPVDDYESSTAKWAEEALERSAEVAKEAGVPFETVHVKDAHPADGILATAEEKKCDLIVMGSHGRRGISRMLLGSQANDVVTRSSLPVLICR